MNPNLASNNPALSSHPALNVVIVYDEFLSGQHAVQTYHRLMLQHGQPTEVHVKTWTFDRLRDHQLNNAAVKDAADAEVIILAAASEEVPPEVESWVEGWLSRPGNGHAEVVAVLNSPAQADPNLSPMENYLMRVASNSGCDLSIEKAH